MKQQPITMPMTIVSYERILKSDHPIYAWPVYSYYCWCVMRDKTNYLSVTTSEVAESLKCSEDKIRKAKKVLIKLGLIENFLKRNERKTAIIGNFIKVNYLNKKDETWNGSSVPTTELLKPQNCQTHIISTKSNINTNTKKIKEEILLNNNIPREGKIFRKRRELETTRDKNKLLQEIELLTKQKEELRAEWNKLTNKKEPIQPIQLDLFPKDELITENYFEEFWKLYPNKAAKGTALSAFLKLCNLKSNASIKPTWKVLRIALKTQANSELWVKCKQYIPHASTWLNNFGWLNNADEMKVFKKEVFTKPNKPERFGFMGKTPTPGIDRIDMVC